ncbi:YajQ family cyclic di-GMP-binding protein [Candidatus Saccharibacteria bacterium]|nr:YajQ family cyclic di-GMP-binding protein [Candidatus Saccharibacteria bacterium]MCB9821643.1 YajQ family cyclic di-GMP-binding protein [Candidatus Nomurabacteria bacterium]
MANFSFDIESTYDAGEMNNVFDQVKRELASRYDLKGTSASIDWLDDKQGFKFTADQQFQLDALIDMVRKVAAKRGLNQKTFDTSAEPTETNLQMYWTVPFRSGLKGDDAKKLTKLFRDEMPKLKVMIQGEAVRVMSPKKDELQTAMQLVRSKEFEFPLSFNNFR